MITKSINILNLNVPCNNRCRYCLLSYNGKTLGVDYERSIRYARAFYQWLRENHSEIGFTYYFGYSMEHPKLFEMIKFLQETNSPSGHFLQFNGMKDRNRQELKEFLTDLKECGIKLLNFTFYGTKEYHDAFSARKGDHHLMIEALEVALEVGLQAEIDVPVTKENLNQIEELISGFSKKNVPIRLFTPHSGGRGIALLPSKITVADYEGLSVMAKSLFNRNNHRTPSEWLANSPKEVENRSLTLSLLKTNMDRLEHQTFEETFRWLEKLDEEYFSIIPSFNQLLLKYCDDVDNHLYSKKDLYFLYRKRYIEENKLEIMDVTDERYCTSIRY